jgi:signal transduction histidine kinase
MVNQSLDLDTILDSALDTILETIKGDSGGILLLNERSQTLSYRVYKGFSEAYVKGVAGLRLGEGISGLAAKLGEPVCTGDFSKDPRVTSPIVRGEGLRAFASVPLQDRGVPIGTIDIARRTARRFSRRDVQLLNSIGHQMAVAIQNARLHGEVQRTAELRREVLREAVSAQEEERRRIARELHDETSQALLSLRMGLEVAVDALDSDPSRAVSKIKEMQALSETTVNELHRLIYELRPSMLDDLGLVPAVQSLAENTLESIGVVTHFETAGEERTLPSQTETLLFRIIQEAVANIARHANAETASMCLEFLESSVTFRIEDDGMGFEPDEIMNKDHVRWLGLLGMNERVELMGGVLIVRSRPGSGTTIDIQIPVGE